MLRNDWCSDYYYLTGTKVWTFFSYFSW